MTISRLTRLRVHTSLAPMTDPSRKVEFYRHDLGELELASIRETLSGVFLATGPRVAQFESLLAAYLGVKHVVGVTSCTDGLLLVLRALDIGPGDEVITTPLTFIATANAVLYTGAKVVFSDVDPTTGLLDPSQVEAKISPRTKAIIVVHLYGQMADVRALRDIADRHGIALIEDSAHGVEMRRDGLVPGQISDAAVFSFYATKTITCGDGGAIATNSDALRQRLLRLRYHGISKEMASRYGGPYAHWDMVELGYKAAMTDLDAALLIPQIERLDKRRAAREQCVRRYEAALRDVPDVELIQCHGISAHHLFTVLVPAARRDQILVAFGSAGVGVTVNYRAVHLLSYYRNTFGYAEGSYPHAENIGNRTISLPLWPGLGHEDIDYVVAQLKRILVETR